MSIPEVLQRTTSPLEPGKELVNCHSYLVALAVMDSLDEDPRLRDAAAHSAHKRESPTAQNLRLPDGLISISDIRELFGLGRTAAYKLTHRPAFPAPIVLSSRCYRWWANEVAAYAASIRREGPRQAV